MSTYKPPEVSDPFEEYTILDETAEVIKAAGNSVLIDLTEKLKTKGKDASKVRLTQLSDSVMAKKKYNSPPDIEVYESMVPSESSIEGILTPDAMPKNAEVFKLNYHMFDGLLEFGVLESSAPLAHVVESGNYYYFKDTEGMWRLEVVTDYN